jgi:hypothetical protein
MKITPLLTKSDFPDFEIQGITCTAPPCLPPATDNKHNIRTFSNGNQCSYTIPITGNNDPSTHTNKQTNKQIYTNKQAWTNRNKQINIKEQTHTSAHLCATLTGHRIHDDDE